MNDENSKVCSNLSPELGDSYSDLSPEVVLDAMHARGFHCDGRLLALNSYENLHSVEHDFWTQIRIAIAELGAQI